MKRFRHKPVNFLSGLEANMHAEPRDAVEAGYKLDLTSMGIASFGVTHYQAAWLLAKH